jgi:hypothetical protein
VTDDPGVMGNLPRSRPGRRSDKRASGTKAAGGGAKATGTGAKARAGGRPRAARPKARPTTGTRPKARPTTGTRPAGTRPAAGTRARSSGPARGAQRSTAPRTAVRDERIEEPQGQDPITAVLKLGMAVGDAGVKAVAKIVQRLPRP